MLGRSESQDFTSVTSSLSSTVPRRYQARSWRIVVRSECTGGDFIESESIEERTTRSPFEIPEEDIEGPWRWEDHEETPGTRQEFDVTYSRNKKSNSWTALTKRGKLYKGVKAAGRGCLHHWNVGRRERRRRESVRLSPCSWNVTRTCAMPIPVCFRFCLASHDSEGERVCRSNVHDAASGRFDRAR